MPIVFGIELVLLGQWAYRNLSESVAGFMTMVAAPRSLRNRAAATALARRLISGTRASP
jgi:hypothetical protein